MTEEQIKQRAREKAKEFEENQTIGIYDDDESLAYDKGYNSGEVTGYEKGFVEGATEATKELEAQIEKMKNCNNCKNEGDYKEPYRYGTGWCNICKRHKVAKGNFDKWVIKEK